MNRTSSNRRFLGTAVALLGLLGLTIGAAHLNLGLFNTIAAMSISVVKAALILLFFMDIRERGKLVWIAFGLGFFWLAIMFALSLSDFMTRGWK